MTSFVHSDGETRRHLLETAVRLFAERGFNRVSVREICKEAGANVAAVNYHFRSKMDLYREVWRFTIKATMEQTHQSVKEAGEGRPAEEKLLAYIRIFVSSILSEGNAHSTRLARLIAHEIAEPTEDPDGTIMSMVFEEGIIPKFMYLHGIVGELLALPVTDERVMFCALSIQGQCLMYQYSKPSAACLPPQAAASFGPVLRPDVEKIASHIAEFSLAGLRATAEKPVEVS